MRRLLALLALAVLCGCGGPPAEVVELRDAELRLGASEHPPRPEQAGWRAVTLPDAWGLRRRSRFVEGWYRAGVDLPRARRDEGPLSVYLPAFSGHVVLYWDGARVGDSGPYRPAATHVARGPLLVVLPEGAGSGERAVLQIRFRATPAAPDYLAPVQVGPRDALNARYQRALVFGRLAPVGFAVAGVLVALVLLAVHWRDPEVPYMPWLSGGLLSGALASAGLFVSVEPLPVRLAEPLRAALFHLTMPCFALALHRVLGLERPRLERLFLGSWAAFCAVAFAVPVILTYAVSVLWSVVTVAVCAYVVVLAGGVMLRMRGWPAVAMALPLLAAVAFVLHDGYAFATGRGIVDRLLSVYAIAMITLSSFSLHLTKSRETLSASRALNRELDARVEQKRQALERNYERLREVEREQAVVAERERLLRDMHDGLGSQLVSTLAMVESGRFESGDLAEALRDTLDDLRLMVHSLDPQETDLLSMLAVVRERIEPRLARHGLRFEWNVADVPEVPGLQAAGVLQVLRIVQEVLANVVKHAEATTISLATGTGRDASGSFVFLSIADDGKGLPDAPRPGRGLSNMRERAAEVGATLEIERESGVPGTRVTLRFPLEAERDPG